GGDSGDSLGIDYMEEIGMTVAHDSYVQSVKYYGNDGQFVSTSVDSTFIFHKNTNKVLKVIDLPQKSRGWVAASHPRVDLVAVGHDKGLVMFNTHPPKRIANEQKKKLPKGVQKIFKGKMGEAIKVLDNSVQLVDFGTDTIKGTLNTKGHIIWNAIWSPCGSYIAIL
ncbi:hypothetical protein ADUPG1_003887, partial [Aduncisulcus paluster]